MKEIVLTNLFKRLKITVPGFEDRSDIDPSTGVAGPEYTVYVIEVKDNMYKNEWKLFKRYSDFSKLYHALKSEYQRYLTDYKFPNKSIFNTFSQVYKLCIFNLTLIKILITLLFIYPPLLIICIFFSFNFSIEVY